jgi:peptidoglycan/LPS O-acetylase OafA/YrhL
MVSLLAAGGLLIGLSTLHSFRLDANSESFNTFGYSLFVVIFASALIQALGLRKGLIRTILTCPPLRYMGWISYTFYLNQVLVLDEVSQHFHARAAVVVLGFVLTGILSAVSWRFFESPILKLNVLPPALEEATT